MRSLLLGLALGVLLLGLARLAAAPLNPTTHHHANWAIVVNGTRIDLSGDRFMEEISACNAGDEGIQPSQRIHMHENLQDVVHVHHQGATWGHLMTNLGLGLGDDFLFLDRGLVEGIDGVAPDGRLTSGTDGGRLVFVVNGFVVPSLTNRVVASEDRALIAWTDGDVETVRTEWFESVANDAGEFNERMDPASCSGGHGDLPFLTRLRLAFWG
jgi:hypothetical protein